MEKEIEFVIDKQTIIVYIDTEGKMILESQTGKKYELKEVQENGNVKPN